MLSPKQKKALFGASIESRPRYVRVPLQMVNGVRELNTDVNFARLVAQFEQTDDRLRSSTDEPIAHIRTCISGRTRPSRCVGYPRMPKVGTCPERLLDRRIAASSEADDVLMTC